jgi:hypothetical protein
LWRGLSRAYRTCRTCYGGKTALSYLLFRSTSLGCRLQEIREGRGRYQGVFVQLHFSVGVNTSGEEVCIILLLLSGVWEEFVWELMHFVEFNAFTSRD